MFKNLIRIGKVSAINAAKGTVRVVMDDQQDIVTDELPMLSFEYYMPDVGDLVLCLFLGNGISKGFCLGRYFSEGNPPPVTHGKIYAKDFGDGTSIQYDKTSKKLSITAAGGLIINGDIKVTGKIESTDDITGSGISLVNHVHGGVTGGPSKTGVPE